MAAPSRRRCDIAARLRQLRQYGWSRRYHADRPRAATADWTSCRPRPLLVMLPHLDRWERAPPSNRAGYAAAAEEQPLSSPCGKIRRPYVGQLCVMQRDGTGPHPTARPTPASQRHPLPDTRLPAAGVVAVLGPRKELTETEAATREILTLPCFRGADRRGSRCRIAALSRHRRGMSAIMSDRPFVLSLVIPVYKRASVPALLEHSRVAQGFRRFEIILVNRRQSGQLAASVP